MAGKVSWENDPSIPPKDLTNLKISPTETLPPALSNIASFMLLKKYFDLTLCNEQNCKANNDQICFNFYLLVEL
jgi:hypothetical protein